jgi:hypothetical protein
MTRETLLKRLVERKMAAITKNKDFCVSTCNSKRAPAQQAASPNVKR